MRDAPRASAKRLGRWASEIFCLCVSPSAEITKAHAMNQSVIADLMRPPISSALAAAR